MRQARRNARCYRSMLFVPGHRQDWVEKAPRFGADALILDLEDAVPLALKSVGRDTTAQALDGFATTSFGTFVRINPWGSGQTLADLSAIVGPGLDGVMLPKTEDAEDIVSLDRVLTELELERGLEVGRIEIFPLCETALGKYRTFEICLASERVKRSQGAGGYVPNADSNRAINVRSLTDEGTEEYLTNLRTGLDARAAGVTEIIGGMTTKIHDLDLVRHFALRAKAVGATGSMAIHPSHVAIHNEVFSPSPDDISDAKAVIAAMADGIAVGKAAVEHNGRMIDYAHVRTSLDLLDHATSLGIDVGTIPHIELEADDHTQKEGNAG
ncbi:CoA ester lyase [Gordonia sp. LSe1-13]|uniref:CoA ester lyase n=1 Tax=Gordonia sesuvii TaxID=3116777 RepID=A0ABU7MIT2_9ACTN|nr:CoA ester lyase [Gordonia sp. LSe1-13]